MNRIMAKVSKEFLKRDIIDITIDEFIIRNGLVGKIPLTIELKRSKV